jgi:hypothetical protein
MQDDWKKEKSDKSSFKKWRRKMKSTLSVILVLIMAPVVSATLEGRIISADADGFPNGTDISAVFDGIILSSVGGYPSLDGKVYSRADGLASTGTNVFANNLSFQRQWYANLAEGFALRADFERPANLVAIDIIGDDTSDYGELQAYNSSGILVGYILSPQLTTGEVFRAAISRDWAFDIAYIIAGGATLTEDSVHLDNLTANVIPEPATLCLMGLGGLLLTGRCKKHGMDTI